MFDLVSDYAPAGDQPQAIAKLTEGILSGAKHQVLLGVTGSGKTFTVANVIRNVNKSLSNSIDYGECAFAFPVQQQQALILLRRKDDRSRLAVLLKHYSLAAGRHLFNKGAKILLGAFQLYLPCLCVRQCSTSGPSIVKRTVGRSAYHGLVLRDV